MNRDKKLLIIFFPRFVLSTEYRFLIEFISLEVTCSRGSCDFPESDQSSNDFFFQSSKWSLTFCLRFLHSFVRLFVCSDMKDSLFLCTNFEMRTWNARHEFVVEKFFRMKSFLMKFWVDNTMSFILYQLVNVQITFKTQFWKNLVD
jgi:hypothetical protein